MIQEKKTENFIIAPIKQKAKKVQERKLAKKSQRPKRRYILFGLSPIPKTGKQAFELVLRQFPQDERKELGTWFIEFNPKTGQGIIRCKLAFLEKVKKALNKIPSAKTLKTSGTLKALKGKQ